MRTVLMASAAAALVLVAACGRAPESSTPPAGTPPAAGAGGAPAAGSSAAGLFTVPQAQLAHLAIVPVTSSTWSATLQTTGTVDWDNDHTTQAITQVSGPITRLAVDTGSQVKAGDPLLYVASADVTGAISTYRKAKNRMDLAQRTLDRSKDLLDHKALAARDLESAQADFNDAATDVQTALQALKILGVGQSDLDEAEHQNTAIRPELAMRAPISGTIVQRLVLPGQIIQAGTTVGFVISDTSTVWIQGHIYEKDLTAIHVGDVVEARNSALPNVFHGTVTYIDRLVDPATRTILVRIVTPNTGGLLKKDLFMDITVHDRTSRSVLSVPVSSVLYDEQNFPFVYLQMEPGKFAQRLVKTGGRQEDRLEILDGLKAGDQVVSQGSLFLQFAGSNGR